MTKPVIKTLVRVGVIGAILSLVSIHAAIAQIPDNWSKRGNAPEDYEAGGNPAVNHGSDGGGYIQSKGQEPKGFGTLLTSIKPDSYLGRRVRLSCFIRSENVEHWAGFWMRVDGPENEVLGFDNMQYRPIIGTTGWKKYDVVVDVPPKSVRIALGILLNGRGKAWVDGAGIEAVGTDVQVTAIDPFGMFYKGDYAGAASNFFAGTARDPEDLYPHLFYYLSLYRNGQITKAQAHIADLSEALEGEKWAAQIVRFYAGKLSEEDLLKAAVNADSTVDNQQRCESYFYIGMAYLLDMEKTRRAAHAASSKAREYFEKCIATRQTDYVEYMGAQAELKRMDK